ncbi:lantibiotic dehydratase C-terminal domain-containing protein [Streptomyces sp. MS06]|uniref:lantibiotic dehydratase C-terminal domain-containing protein n=1 Tax=Streptomyces sp. MS06 TaxID=3385974 RepID=UPI0039A23566
MTSDPREDGTLRSSGTGSAPPARTPRGGPRGWRTWHLHLPSWGTDVTDRALVLGVAPAVARYASAPRAATDATPAPVPTPPAPAPQPAPTAAGEGDDSEHPWFFVRYWQGGPHLRLRIAGLGDEEARGVTETLRRAADAVDAEVPAERRLTQADYASSVGSLARTGEGAGPLDQGVLLPPGVVRAAYVPENGRYGGAGLMPLSEDLFHRSSVLALGACREPRTRRQVFGQALAATAAATSALPGQDRRPFLEAVRDGWAAWLSAHDRDGGPPPGPPGAASAPPAPSPVAGPPDALRAQADQLRGAKAELLRLMDDPGPPWEVWATPLRAAVDVWAATGGRERALGVLGSHLHMTLNRLGAGTAQEARLAALLLLVTGDAPG